MLTDLILNRDSDTPLYEQIAEQLRTRIRDGAVTAGVKLPASREVAKSLGVHRRTVVQAYERLAAEGWVRSGVGQGTFVHDTHVSRRVAGAASDSSHDPSPGVSFDPAVERFVWEHRLRPSVDPAADVWRHLSASRPPAGCIQFSGATADPAAFPMDDFRAILNEVLTVHGTEVLDYGPPEGLSGLREWIAERLTRRGVAVDRDQVLIVNGSQQGLDLIARVLLTPGDTVVMEEPCYPSGFRLFRSFGARTKGVPMDDGGMRLDLLAGALERENPALLYLMPIFQNPTGLSLDARRVTPLLDLAARYGVPVVEDQFDGELAYDDEPPQPIKASDRRDQVILIGTFSKILFPGARLGWLVVPKPLLCAVREQKQLADLSSGLLLQHAMELYCRRGLLDLHLDRVRTQNRNRLRVLLESLEAFMPPGVQWTRPRGGLTVWVRLPAGCDAMTLLSEARAVGVDFTPGPLFFPEGGGQEFLRLGYVRESEARIRKGVELLAERIGARLEREPESSGQRPWI